MIVETSSAECPRPVSFAWAFSMFSARSMPPFAASPATAVPIPTADAATAPIAAAPAFATVENAPDRPPEMFFCAAEVLTEPSSFSMADLNPFIDGLIWIHAVPRLRATGPPCGVV